MYSIFSRLTSFANQALVPVDRTFFPSRHDPHNSLRAPAREGDITGTKLVDSASPPRQWPQANLSYSNRLIGGGRQPCGCSVVLFHQISELLGNLFVDSPLCPWCGSS